MPYTLTDQFFTGPEQRYYWTLFDAILFESDFPKNLDEGLYIQRKSEIEGVIWFVEKHGDQIKVFMEKFAEIIMMTLFVVIVEGYVPRFY